MLILNDLAAALGRHSDHIPSGKLNAVVSAIPAASALRTEVFSADDIKRGAHELGAALAAAGAPLKHGRTLKLVSGLYGFRSWNAALGALGREADISVPDVLPWEKDRLGFCSPRQLHGALPRLASAAQAGANPEPRVMRSVSAEFPAGQRFGGTLISGWEERPAASIARHLGAGTGYASYRSKIPYLDAMSSDPDVIIFDRPDPLDTRAMIRISSAAFAGHHVLIATDRLGDYEHVQRAITASSREITRKVEAALRDPRPGVPLDAAMERIRKVIDKPRAPRPPRSARSFLEEFLEDEAAGYTDAP